MADNFIPTSHSQEIDKTRITMVDHLYFHPPDGNPTLIKSSYDYLIDSDEEPYQRKMKVGPEWKQLDFAWVADEGVRVFVVENLGPPIRTMLSPQETQALTLRLRFIGASEEQCWIIPVKEAIKLNPPYVPKVPQLEVSTMGGTTRCILSAIPR